MRVLDESAALKKSKHRRAGFWKIALARLTEYLK
jgi:hypothetical protein